MVEVWIWVAKKDLNRSHGAAQVPASYSHQLTCYVTVERTVRMKSGLVSLLTVFVSWSSLFAHSGHIIATIVAEVELVPRI